MHVLLLTTSNAKVPPAYYDKLRSWGITSIHDELTPTQGRKESEGDFMHRVTSWARDEYGDTVDLVQVFFDRKDWPLSSGVTGKQYHAFFNDYQVAIVRYYGKDVAGTAEHELMHSVDNFCRTYTGVDLAKVVGVEDWDDDIVHRRGKNGRYSNSYDDVYPIARPYLEAAIIQRWRVQKITSLKLALERLLVELRKLKVAGKAPEELPEAPQSPATAKPEPNPVPPAQGLYDAAYASIGRDMSDRAPDHLGCADAVNNIHQLAFGHEIGGGTSTYLLYDALRTSPRFTLASGKPQRGDIVISPSGYSSKGAKNGHVGIVGKNTSPDGTLWVMSNDGFKGTWEANYTLKSWRAYFGTKLGFPVHIFRLV